MSVAFGPAAASRRITADRRIMVLRVRSCRFDHPNQEGSVRRSLSILVTFVGVLGLVGLMPAADADTKVTPGAPTLHRTEPGPPDVPLQLTGQCAVTGSVTIDKGVGAQPSHNHYSFVGAQITCTGSNFGSGPNGSVPEAYSVSAEGYTDGPSATWVDTSSIFPAVVGPNHGETSDRGWGWGKGDIDVTSTLAQCGTNKAAEDGGLGADQEKAASENYVEFTRIGNAVTAWGRLKWTGGCEQKDDTCFLTELVLGDPELGTNPGSGDVVITQATLVGEAVLWSESVSDCQGDKQTWKKDPKG